MVVPTLAKAFYQMLPILPFFKQQSKISEFSLKLRTELLPEMLKRYIFVANFR
jgi:hypothetical protein